MVIMQVFLRFFLVFGLQTLGASLQCESCTSTGTTCEGELKLCDSDQTTCSVQFIESTLGGKKTVNIRKKCDYADLCSLPPISMSLGDGKYHRSSISCCIGEGCQSFTPLRMLSSELNGVKCPSCYLVSDAHKTSCIEAMTNCTALESYCFDMHLHSGKAGKNSEITMKGCTTRSVCSSLKRGQSILGNTGMVQRAECSPDISRGVQSSGRLLSTIYAFLWLKTAV